MNLNQLKTKLLENDDFKKQYEKYDLAMEVGLSVFEARRHVGLSQIELAERMGTKQPSIARIENGGYLPGLNLLNKVATALGTYLIAPKFAFLESDVTTHDNGFVYNPGINVIENLNSNTTTFSEYSVTQVVRMNT